MGGAWSGGLLRVLLSKNGPWRFPEMVETQCHHELPSWLQVNRYMQNLQEYPSLCVLSLNKWLQNRKTENCLLLHRTKSWIRGCDRILHNAKLTPIPVSLLDDSGELGSLSASLLPSISCLSLSLSLSPFYCLWLSNNTVASKDEIYYLRTVWILSS